HFLLGELLDGFVGIEESGTGEDTTVPSIGAVPGNGEGPLVQRLVFIEQLREIEIVDASHAFTAGAHATGARVGGFFCLRTVSALDGDRPTGPDGRHIEGKGAGWTDVRLPEPAEKDTQHG